MSETAGPTPPYDSSAAPSGPIPGFVELVLELAAETDGSYQVRASSASGTGDAVVRLPAAELVAHSERIGRTVRGAAAAPALPPEIAWDVAALGQELFDAVFVDSVRETYHESRRAAEANDASLRIVVSLAGAPELMAVPWEALYEEPLFLATQRNTAVVRRVSSQPPLHPVLVPGQVRILGVIATPSDMPPLNATEERRRVLRQLEPVTAGGLCRIDWLEPATMESLQAALRRDYHVLHYVGHSGLTPAGQGVIVLERDDGSSHHVSGSQLANMIGRRTQLRLVILNSCASAAAVEGDPFSGISTKLVALGLPAVIAMQYVVGDSAAVTFGSELYRSLIAGGQDVENATGDARLAVLADGHDVDWVAPVLFVHGDRSRLFDLSLLGWYTLDGSRPVRSPERGRPGLLGLAPTDPIERAMRLLGRDFDMYSIEGRTTRCWTFQGESRVCVTEQDGSIIELSASIDGDVPGSLRISLPYGLLLGQSTLKDTLAAEQLHSPNVRRDAPENVLSETWSYVCPDAGEGWIKIDFTSTTFAGREESPPDWFSWDMDFSDRLVTSCRVSPRG